MSPCKGSLHTSPMYQEFMENMRLKIPFAEAEMPQHLLNTILNKSCESMSEIPDNSVHLVITSPPYNVGKSYDNDWTLTEYLDFLRKIFAELYRVIVPYGRVCVNITNVGRMPRMNLAYMVANLLAEVGFIGHGEIIWNKGASAGQSTAWGSWRSASCPCMRDEHEYIFVFSKGLGSRVLTPEQKKYKESTISGDDFIKWTRSIWTLETESATKSKHPAPFPVALPARLISVWSFTHDVILDPFMGSGTTAVAAKTLDRNFIGYELSKEYWEIAMDRVTNTMTLFEGGK